jgi:hypothetical protein
MTQEMSDHVTNAEDIGEIPFLMRRLVIWELLSL